MEIKTEVDDAIFDVLLGVEKISFNKLYEGTRRKWPIATFYSHLKSLIKLGHVKCDPRKKRGFQRNYWIDSGTKTRTKRRRDILYDYKIKWEKELGEVERFVKAYSKSSKKEISLLKKMKVPLYTGLVNYLVDMYKFSQVTSFVGTSGLYEKIEAQRAKKFHETQLKDLEKTLYKMKRIDPKFHFKLCILVSKKMLTKPI